MDRNDKMFVVGVATLVAYTAVVFLLLSLLGGVWALSFVAVTATLTALGFYGSLLEDGKKHGTRPF